MPIVPQGKVAFPKLSFIHDGMLESRSLSLWKHQSCCEFISAMTMLNPENILQNAFLSSSSYIPLHLQLGIQIP